ncbi:MAG TPA: hypothetical protein VHC49_22875 [Mycobacteriales bacterium]|nr:hypothetical protein [Mycobacteriales bacterium]
MSNADSEPPAILSRVADLLSGYGRPWLLCGGWAVDAWLGRRTRDHLDVDIAVFQDDQAVLFDYLAGWSLVGHDPNVADDTTEPWNGRRLDLPAHVHANHPEMGGVELDIQLNERVGPDWVLAPGLTVPLTGDRAWGLPVALPEAVLFYKAGERIRAHDEHDFRALAPTLPAERRAWLRAAIERRHPRHPWSGRLGV